MYFRSFALMFFVCLNIDFARQSLMRYKVKSIILSRKLAERNVPDLTLLPITQKIAVFGALGITFGPRDTTSL